MPLVPPTPALRRFVNRSNGVAKFGLVVQPGHEVEVSDDVAAQLPREFRELDRDEVFVHPALIVEEPADEADPEPVADEPAPAPKARKRS